MIIELLRRLKGCVYFEAECGFSERFLNLCRNNGIILWNVKNNGVKVCAFTDSESAKRLQAPADNSGMALKLVKEYGVLYSVKRHKRRYGAVIGVLVAAVTVAVLSSMLWSVEIVNEDGVNVDGFTETLAELGVKRGAFLSKIDIPDVQRELVDRFPQLSWVSLNIYGSKALVEMSVKKTAPQIEDMKTLSNVIAAKSGKITLIGLRAGTKLVKEGMIVTKGELLISGVTEGMFTGEHLCRADGFVNAITNTQFKTEISLHDKTSVVTERKTLYGVCAFGLELEPFFKADKSISKSKTTVFARTESAVLPLGVILQNGYDFAEREVDLTEAQARLCALLAVVENKREEFQNAEIVSEKYVFTATDGKCALTSVFEAEEDIAERVPLLTEESE